MLGSVFCRVCLAVESRFASLGGEREHSDKNHPKERDPTEGNGAAEGRPQTRESLFGIGPRDSGAQDVFR